MSPFLQQFADRAVESLIAPGAGSWQVGVDHPVCHCVQNGRGRLPVLDQRHGNTQAGRGRAAPRDHPHPLGGRLDAAGLGEELAAGTGLIAEAAIITATGRSADLSSRRRPRAVPGEASLMIR
jgi:hypothetical protein